MSEAPEDHNRGDLLNRLRRAEGQLRGIQRMIEADQPSADIASQLWAVRKALDSTHVQLTLGVVRQTLRRGLAGSNGELPLPVHAAIDSSVGQMQELLAKMR